VTRTRTALGGTLLALAVPGLVALAPVPGAAAASPVAARDDTDGSGLSLTVPRRQVVLQEYGNTSYSDLGLRLLNTSSAPLEVRSTRASYDVPVEVRATTAAGEVELPDTARVGTLDKLVTVRLQPRVDGKPRGRATVRRYDGCLGSGTTERARPDAPATTPYPTTCSYNPYALGGVQGLQRGWSASLLGYRPLRLPRGTYDLTATVRGDLADALGMTSAERTRTSRVIVKKGPYYEDPDWRRAARGGAPGSSPEGPAPAERPAALHHPGPDPEDPGSPEPVTGVDGPRPDLRSLPAWGIGVSRSGKYLQFGATVWNGGDSPLVVDGFRREREDVMDGYQYFFDTTGEQVGYQPVGAFEWDAKGTHQHWHFQDFATYSLLRADKSVAVKSRKEAFCLANTDAVDLTVPGADWSVDNEQLETSCGDYGSQSIREVLASGWGDTYAQFRAGQSFGIAGLPNGTYYIEVRANPEGNLVESDETNNVALRKIRLSGRGAGRQVTVAPVGIVDETMAGGYGEF